MSTIKIPGPSYTQVAGNILLTGYNAIVAKFPKAEMDRLVDFYSTQHDGFGGIIFTDGYKPYFAGVRWDAEYNWNFYLTELMPPPACDIEKLICYNNDGKEVVYFWTALIDPFRVSRADYTVGIISNVVYFGSTPIYAIRGIQPKFRVVFAGQDADGIGEIIGFPSISVFNTMDTHVNEISRLSMLQAIMSMLEMLGGGF
jgi:hypothetical protein